MSLFDCPACGETVPQASVSCTRCGHRFKHETMFSLTGPAVFTVLVMTLTVIGLLVSFIGIPLWVR